MKINLEEEQLQKNKQASPIQYKILPPPPYQVEQNTNVIENLNKQNLLCIKTAEFIISIRKLVEDTKRVELELALQRQKLLTDLNDKITEFYDFLVQESTDLTSKASAHMNELQQR